MKGLVCRVGENRMRRAWLAKGVDWRATQGGF